MAGRRRRRVHLFIVVAVPVVVAEHEEPALRDRDMRREELRPPAALDDGRVDGEVARRARARNEHAARVQPPLTRAARDGERVGELKRNLANARGGRAARAASCRAAAAGRDRRSRSVASLARSPRGADPRSWNSRMLPLAGAAPCGGGLEARPHTHADHHHEGGPENGVHDLAADVGGVHDVV